MTPQERQLRQERHKVHVISLLSMGLVRNRWLNDKELQARLISQLPPQIHALLASITRERYPNSRDRSRLFENNFLKDLLSWWYQTFKILPGRELKRRSLNEVEKELKKWEQEFDKLNKQQQQSETKRKGKGKGKQSIDPPPPPSDPPSSSYKKYPWEESEIISYEKRLKRLKTQSSTSTSSPLVRPFGTSPSTWEPLSSPLSSLYASVSNLKGSKDLSVQLLVALLRGLDVPCRLVISLQGMEWRSDSASGLTKTKTKQKGNGKGKQVETIELNTTTTDDGEEDDKWRDGRGKLNYKVPKVNLRRSGPTGKKKKMANWEKEKMLMRSPSPGESSSLLPF